MKKAFLWLIKCICAGIVAVIVLSIISFGYSYSGKRLTNESGSTDYKREPNSLISSATEGFSYVFSDSQGFFNDTDCHISPDVLLMGSSHMEAINVSLKENTATKLSAYTDLSVYNIGISAHDFTHCVNNLSAAMTEFSPKKYVIIETTDVVPDIAKLKMVLDGTLPRIETYDSGLVRLVQSIPCAKWLVRQLLGVLEIESPDYDDDKADISVKATLPDDYYSVLDSFLKKAKADSDGRTLIIMYHQRLMLKSDGTAYVSIGNDARQRFGELCEENDIVFVDMTDTFLRRFALDYTLPYGFCNTQSGVGHLNRQGHEMISEELAKTISQLETKSGEDYR